MITLMENSVFVAPGIHSYIHCLTQCRSEDMDGFKEKRLVIYFPCVFFFLSFFFFVFLDKHSPAPVDALSVFVCELAAILGEIMLKCM